MVKISPKKKTYGPLAFLLLLAVSFVACFYPTIHPDAIESFDTGNIAWMILSSALVLLMTPGLSFFLWRNGKA